MTFGTQIKEIAKGIQRSATVKLFTVFLLIMILLIPASMIESLIWERECRHQEVVEEINAKWGRAQTISGPVISVPFQRCYVDENGRNCRDRQYKHFLPDTLDIQTEIAPEKRYRGIYEAVLYNSTMDITGRFPDPRREVPYSPEEEIFWSEAVISMGVTDMRGIKDRIGAHLGNAQLSMEPGIPTDDVILSGVSAAINLEEGVESFAFHFSIDVNGSEEIGFVPAGKVTTVSALSGWPDPSFSGAFLPAERSIREDGFTADWKILHLNRNYPQQWTGAAYKLDDSAFGVKMYVPVDIYQKSMRTSKYALMFIVFTFLAFFFSEIMNRLRVHPVQYLLVGFAIILFYVLLISISEHLNFETAYLIASACVIVLVSGYTKSILNNKRATAMVAGVLLLLYLYLFILLQLEDFALLMGSLGLFAVLGLVMYLTRRIDWYAIRLSERCEVEDMEMVGQFGREET